MFKHILVPLDGSKLAEAGLPVAALLCQKLEATATLLHVIEKDASPQVHGERHLTNEDEASKYLGETAKAFFPPEILVEVHVHSEKVENVARSIVEHSGEFSPDLIIMCAHGQSGLHDVVVGSIAQQVISRGKVPILLIHPVEGIKASPPVFRNFVVPLDGNPEHEASLVVAGELALLFAARLVLLRVVHTLSTLPGEKAATGWMLPGATRAILEIDEETSQEYLQSIALPWQKRKVEVVLVVRRGDPAQQIEALAQKLPADLLVLGTHGKAGMTAFWAGSVAPKVVTNSTAPLMLVPVHKG